MYESLIRNRETDISDDTLIGFGDCMAKVKNKLNLIEVGQIAVLLFLIFYGFFALTNPQLYPVLGRITPFGRLDPLIGLIMLLLGVYFLFRR